MATSGALSTSNQYVKYKITITEKSRSATQLANNKTPVDVSVNFYRTNTGYTTFGVGTVYCRINGTLYWASVAKTQVITNSGIVLFSKSLEIPHNADGTKTLTVSAWIEHDAPLTSNEQSYSLKLSDIPRASQPSCITWPNHTQNVGNFGDTISIHTNRASPNFTHTLRYQFGSQSGTIATGVGTGTTWTIPVSLMNLIPNVTSGSGTIYCDTYNGSTKIGTKWCGFTATVPTSVKPSCSIQVLDGTTTQATYGNLVKGMSTLKVNVTGTVAYKSPIAAASTTVTVGGVARTYSGLSFTTPVLWGSGTVTVSSTVTDERGRKSAAASASFTVLAYDKPKITAFSVYRCDEDGTENDAGDYIKSSFSAVVTSLNSKNTATYKLRYTNNATEDTTEKALTTYTGKYTVTNHTDIFQASGDNTFTVDVVVKDNTSEIVASKAVSTAFTLLNYHPSGTGLRFGGVAEDEHTLANDLELRQIGNSYAFQPDAFGGAKGYTLMAAITLNTLNVNAPIVFVLNRRGAACPMTLYARFASSSTTTDPELGSFTYEGDNYGAFLVKVATSTWKLYVDNTGGWSNPCLQTWFTTDNQNDRISVTFPSEQVEALTSPWYRAVPVIPRSILDAFYPVGTIIHRYDQSDPNTMYAGTTWVRIANRFLWGCDADGDVGVIGGEKTHTLTANEIPSHNHGGTYTNAGTAAKTHAWLASGGSAMAYDTVNAGGGAAHNNMPPYIQVSIWRRTA